MFIFGQVCTATRKVFFQSLYKTKFLAQISNYPRISREGLKWTFPTYPMLTIFLVNYSKSFLKSEFISKRNCMLQKYRLPLKNRLSLIMRFRRQQNKYFEMTTNNLCNCIQGFIKQYTGKYFLIYWLFCNIQLSIFIKLWSFANEKS